MAGYIGTKASVVTPGAERKKVFSITTTTTSLTGLVYTPGFVHVFHNGVRLVDGTDYTATNGTSITLTTAAQNGDEVVVISYATFQTSDTVSASAGGTFSNDVAINGNLTVSGTVTGATNLPRGVPAFSAYSSIGQALSGGTSTKILFDQEDFDTSNSFASSRFTPNVAGYYQFNCGVRADTTIAALHVGLSASSVSNFASGTFTNSSLNAFMSSCSGVVYLNGVGDYVEVFSFSGNNITLSTGRGATYFQGFLVRAGA